MSGKQKNFPSDRKIVSMGGHSDSGKTTVATWLIGKLSGLGYDLVYIKNIPHDDLALDKKGKDTDRAFQAGAGKVIGRTPTRTFSLEKKSEDLYDIIQAQNPVSVIVVEGFHAEIPDSAGTMRIHVSSPSSPGKNGNNKFRAEIEILLKNGEVRKLEWPDEQDSLLKTIKEYIEG